YRYQLVYGSIILPVHLIAFWLLAAHTPKWARAVRVGYLLNQLLMLVHDVWTCFLFRGFALLPYPIAFCRGPACAPLGGYNCMTLEVVFMIHSMFIFMFMLLMLNQQMMPSFSRYKL
ncbi:hypothetical protein PFISCL1PPCAC_26291, partial [Pristionchus fissidentatus]